MTSKIQTKFDVHFLEAILEIAFTIIIIFYKIVASSTTNIYSTNNKSRKNTQDNRGKGRQQNKEIANKLKDE